MKRSRWETPMWAGVVAATALCLVLQALPLRAAQASSNTVALVQAGQSAYEKGAFGLAAADWEQALNIYREQKDTTRQARTSMALASALQALGQQQRAVQLLSAALAQAPAAGDTALVTAAKAKLGAALILASDLDRADLLLSEALAEARATNNSKLAAAILNDRGNLLSAQGQPKAALQAYAESATLAREQSDHALAAEALCNAASVAALAQDNGQADTLNGDALAEISHLSDSHRKAFLLVTTAQTERQIKGADGDTRQRQLRRAYDALQQAKSLATQLRDRPMASFALGTLGELYDRDGQLEAALRLTRQAIFAAQQAQIPDLLYRWEWQLGRLLRKSGQVQPAIDAYRQAVQALQPIRTDIALGYGNSRSHQPFREAQGPLYFELADLLFTQVDTTSDPTRANELLLEARDTVEQLKAVELEDYFRDDCVNLQRAKTRAIEAVDPHTAVIYLIPLPNRTELLVGLMSGLKRFTVDVTGERLAAEVRQFRRHLETRTSYAYLGEAQQLYDWLFRPMRSLLAKDKIDTLVIVPDGALRTIPLAALHDGDHFLVQDYAVAVAPGLSLVEPHPIEREHVRLLLNGLSEPVQGFPALNYVPGELQSIETVYRSDLLMNEQFTLEELDRKLKDEQYSIVHIASHGQFDRDVRKTFILTHDGKLTLNHLEALIRPSQYRGRPVEMLVLSACQTAAGDDRAALGLAGVAVKAGARSALATLWFVNDQSTSRLIGALYQQLRRTPAVSKARALQAAQLELLQDRRYRHPCYWSPYLIIGDWL